MYTIRMNKNIERDSGWLRWLRYTNGWVEVHIDGRLYEQLMNWFVALRGTNKSINDNCHQHRELSMSSTRM